MDVEAGRQQIYDRATVELVKHTIDRFGYCRECGELQPCSSWRGIERSKILDREEDRNDRQC